MFLLLFSSSGGYLRASNHASDSAAVLTLPFLLSFPTILGRSLYSRLVWGCFNVPWCLPNAFVVVAHFQDLGRGGDDNKCISRDVRGDILLLGGGGASVRISVILFFRYVLYFNGTSAPSDAGSLALTALFIWGACEHISLGKLPVCWSWFRSNPPPFSGQACDSLLVVPLASLGLLVFSFPCRLPS